MDYNVITLLYYNILYYIIIVCAQLYLFIFVSLSSQYQLNMYARCAYPNTLKFNPSELLIVHCIYQCIYMYW